MGRSQNVQTNSHGTGRQKRHQYCTTPTERPNPSQPELPITKPLEIRPEAETPSRQCHAAADNEGWVLTLISSKMSGQEMPDRRNLPECKTSYDCLAILASNDSGEMSQ
jgi:hypothetical protein